MQTAVRRLGRSGEVHSGIEGASGESDAGSQNNGGTGDAASSHPLPLASPQKIAHESVEKESVKELRAAKTREILEKIRNAKAQSAGSK